MDSQPWEVKTVQLTYSIQRRKCSISFAASIQQSPVVLTKSQPGCLEPQLMAPAVTKLVNILIKTGELPMDWKLAFITPIPKKWQQI